MANEWALLLFGSMLAAFALNEKKTEQLSAPIVTGESSSNSKLIRLLYQRIDWIFPL